MRRWLLSTMIVVAAGCSSGLSDEEQAEILAEMEQAFAEMEATSTTTAPAVALDEPTTTTTIPSGLSSFEELAEQMRQLLTAGETGGSYDEIALDVPALDPTRFGDGHWSVDAFDTVVSEPRVVGDVVLADVVWNAGGASVVALDLTTGEPRYSYPTDLSFVDRRVAWSTVVSSSQGIFVRLAVGDASGVLRPRLIGHDIASGEVLWERDDLDTTADGYLCGGQLCLLGDDELVALNLRTGELERDRSSHFEFRYWEDGGGWMIGYTDQGLVGTNEHGFRLAWDLSFSEIRERVGRPGLEFFSGDKPEGVRDGDVVVLSFRSFVPSPSSVVVAVDLATGELAWGESFSHPACVPFTQGEPVVLTCLDDDPATAVRLDPQTGDVLWSAATNGERDDAVRIYPWGDILALDRWFDGTAVGALDPEDGSLAEPPTLTRCTVLDIDASFAASWFPGIGWGLGDVIHPAACRRDTNVVLDLGTVAREAPELVPSIAHTHDVAPLSAALRGWHVGVDADGRITGIRIDPA